MIVYAVTASGVANSLFNNIVDPLIAAMAFIALLLLIVTAVRFVANADAAEKRGGMFKNLSIIILGIFIIFSIYTLFSFVARLSQSDQQLNKKEHIQFAEYQFLR